MSHDVKVALKQEMPLCSMFWIAYFMLSIAAIGLPIAYGICLPLYLLSWIHPGARDGADSILCWGIGRLMRVQPWWNGNIDLTAPMGGALLVSNHRSHLDAFLFLSRIKGVRMLARQSLFNNPFLGIMMMASGQISTRRGRVDSFWRAMNMVERKLNSGQTVLVFPEMTRCPEGFSGTAHFVTAPFLAAKRAQVPVMPIVIEGTDAVWPRGFFGLRPKQRVRVRTLPVLDPNGFSSAEELCKETKRRMDVALAGI